MPCAYKPAIAGVSIKPGAQAPGWQNPFPDEAREAGDSLNHYDCHPFHGLRTILSFLILGLAPQALCLRLLSQAKSLDYQSVVSKLDASRQARRIASVLDVVSDMSKESPARLQLVHIAERFINPQMCRVFSETQTIEHEHVQTLQRVHGRPRNLAEICQVRKIVEAISHHWQSTVNHFQRRDLQILSDTET